MNIDDQDKEMARGFGEAPAITESVVDRMDVCQWRQAEEARLRSIREEEESRLRAEVDRLAKERLAADERDRKAREAVEAKAKAKREKEEAAERERLRKLNEVMDARQMLDAFVTRFGHIKEFAKVVKAIEVCLAKAEPLLVTKQPRPANSSPILNSTTRREGNEQITGTKYAGSSERHGLGTAP